MLVHPYLHGNYINILERNPKPNPNQEPGKLENLVYHKLQKKFSQEFLRHVVIG